ncbi:hypothetical protein SAMN04488556_1427 [Halostagnicola kamekurae]|uniref:Uncharacterized protein n=2 Tax=Halostagnicola kamekurae TaxID=619731 RepID=A0A1I6QPR7_9EURY|nr:hypothetical protein SAMN04488556_1427 [Halostagnicola kamekurae]
MLITVAVATAALFYALVASLGFGVEHGIVNLDQSDRLVNALLIAGLFMFYLVLTFISTFFSTALVHASHDAFAGRQPDTYRSLILAKESVGSIFVWSVVSATIGVVLQLVGRRIQITSLLFSMAWAAMTFFIVPVIALEQPSIRGMLTRSGAAFKDAWGESAVGATGIGMVQGVIVLIGGLVAVSVSVTTGNSQLVLTIGAITMIMMLLLGSTVGGIVKTALYLHANEGELPGEFAGINPDELVTETNQSPTSNFETDLKSDQL